MMSGPQSQEFSIKWNSFSQHIVTVFEEDEFTDVTLSCEGKRIKCHKVLLSAYSLYFKETFRETPCKHPVIILKGVEYEDLQAVVNFMYTGQVNISEERLSSFLQTAKLLQIKGLNDMNDVESNSTTSIKKPSQTNSTEPTITTTTTTTTTKEPSRTNLPYIHMVKSEVVTPEAARPPSPKRKRMNSGSFVQNHLQSEINNNDSQVPPRLDKTEKFVYTNEDLGISMNGDSDNESGKDEPEISVTEVFVTSINSPDNSGHKLNENHLTDGLEVSESCPWCAEVFTCLPLLQRHIKDHMPGPHKPFSCHTCDSTFARSAHLKRHLRTHTGEKPYQCSVCQRQFARQDKLKTHLEKIHLQNSTKTIIIGL